MQQAFCCLCYAGIPASDIKHHDTEFVKGGTVNNSQRIYQALAAAGFSDQVNNPTPSFTENSLTVQKRRYLSKDREGNILENTDGMFRRVAKNLSQADLNYAPPTGLSGEEGRQKTEDEFYALMRSLDFLPNSPTLMNAGRELQQLSACFVLPVEDSLESIFTRVKQTALIHQSGGGTGFSFSRLRPHGDIVGSTGGVASGPVSFIRAFDTATDVVKQGGTRRGANMAILNVDHPDIIEFIKSKEDGRQLQNFNISVAITEDFMQKVLGNQEYDLVNPRNNQVTGQLNAREVFALIVQMAWQTGDPGIVFLDRINKDNPNPQLGRIESTNPCGEQPLLPFESCNLGSINLARAVNYTKDVVTVDFARLGQAVHATVHLLDNVIDMNNYPIQEIADMSRKTRRIGIGVMGFADLLVQMGVKYDSDDALFLATKIMQFIQQGAYIASKELAKSRGAFSAWEGSTYHDAGIHMRNSAPVTIAPTGTISIIAGASSGIEPLFALAYTRNVMDNDRLIEVNPYFEAVAKQEGFYSEELMQELTQKGSLETLEVPPWVKEVFRVSHDISPEWHVKIQAAFQKHTDNSVSKTINFPHSATKEDVANAYMLAYETGCKGITIYRDGSKDNQVLSIGTTEHQIELPLHVNGHAIPKNRPQVMKGVTERVLTGHGKMYITINFDDTGKPFEVFSALGKAGGCDSAQLEAISRLTALALRSGVDPSQVIDQLRGITCCPAWDDGTLVRSGPDALAIALSRHLENHVDIGDWRLTKCPECDGQTYYQEGCVKCMSCGWNRCE